jgi:hypothetical protein
MEYDNRRCSDTSVSIRTSREFYATKSAPLNVNPQILIRLHTQVSQPYNLAVLAASLPAPLS